MERRSIGRRAPLVIVEADDLEAAEAAVREAGGEGGRWGSLRTRGGRRFHFRGPGGERAGGDAGTG